MQFVHQVVNIIYFKRVGYRLGCTKVGAAEQSAPSCSSKWTGGSASVWLQVLIVQSLYNYGIRIITLRHWYLAPPTQGCSKWLLFIPCSRGEQLHCSWGQEGGPVSVQYRFPRPPARAARHGAAPCRYPEPLTPLGGAGGGAGRGRPGAGRGGGGSGGGHPFCPSANYNYTYTYNQRKKG